MHMASAHCALRGLSAGARGTTCEGRLSSEPDQASVSQMSVDVYGFRDVNLGNGYLAEMEAAATRCALFALQTIGSLDWTETGVIAPTVKPLMPALLSAFIQKVSIFAAVYRHMSLRLIAV